MQSVFFRIHLHSLQRKTVADDLKDTIIQTAQGPKSASNDMGSAEAQSLPDLIEADKYVSAKNALKKSPFGIVSAKIVAPGAC